MGRTSGNLATKVKRKAEQHVQKDVGSKSSKWAKSSGKVDLDGPSRSLRSSEFKSKEQSKPLNSIHKAFRNVFHKELQQEASVNNNATLATVDLSKRKFVVPIANSNTEGQAIEPGKPKKGQSKPKSGQQALQTRPSTGPEPMPSQPEPEFQDSVLEGVNESDDEFNSEGEEGTIGQSNQQQNESMDHCDP